MQKPSRRICTPALRLAPFSIVLTFSVLLISCANQPTTTNTPHIDNLTDFPTESSQQTRELPSTCTPVQVHMPTVCPKTKSALCETCAVCPVCDTASKPTDKFQPPILTPTTWAELPGWGEDNLPAAMPALLRSCESLSSQPQWRNICQALPRWENLSSRELQKKIEQYFQPYRLTDSRGVGTGRATGYYEPLLYGSLKRSATYPYPVYATPTDMVSVQLDQQYPTIKGMRLRGRLVGNTLVPYYTRREIMELGSNMSAPVLLWVNNLVELMFLEIQGSGRVQLPDGTILRLSYANQNGHPFSSIGGYLLRQGFLKANQLSAQSIKLWAHNHPENIGSLLDANPSFVFFRLWDGDPSLGPPGTLGVPLTPERSVAVDAKYVPLGSFLWIDTTWPNNPTPLRRLVSAQDTGGAITGAVRVDYFWGYGDEAGNLAGKMSQNLAVWMLLPKNASPTSTARGK